MCAKWRRLVCVLSLLTLTGCGPAMVWVTRRPAFPYEKVQCIGVMVFAVAPKDPDAQGSGAAVADKIARLLIEHHDYQVVTPEQIAKTIDEKKYTPPLPLDGEAVKKIGEWTGVDTLVTGTITTCTFSKSEQTRLQPEFVDTGYGIYPERAYPYRSVKLEAEIAAQMQVYDTRNGAVLWTDSFSYKSWAQGAPPSLTREQLLDDAADQVAAKLFLGLVVHKDHVKVPEDCIFTCQDMVGHEFVNRIKEFSARDPKVVVALRLNSAFSNVKVRVAVYKKGQETPLAQAERLLGPKETSAGFPFNVKDLTAKGGYGKYKARFYIGDVEVRTTEFIIRP